MRLPWMPVRLFRLASHRLRTGQVLALSSLDGDGVSLSTGDNFVTAPPEIASDIVDMEGYAIRQGMPSCRGCLFLLEICYRSCR